MSEELTKDSVILLGPAMDVTAPKEAACPRPGPWFAGAEPERAQGCLWESAALSSCDSSACTFCHRAETHASQLRQGFAAFSRQLTGKHRRVLSRHGRPQHQHQKLIDQGGSLLEGSHSLIRRSLLHSLEDVNTSSIPEGGQLQSRSVSLMSGHKRTALSPLRERQGVFRPGVDSHERHSPLTMQGRLLNATCGQDISAQRPVRRCSSLTQDMFYSKRARTSGRSSFDATSSLREGSCQGRHARAHVCEWTGPASLTQLATARPLTSSQGASSEGSAPRLVGGLEFSPDGLLLASGGSSRHLQLYSLEDVELRDAGGNDQATLAPKFTHRLPGRLTALSWNPWHEGVLAVGDYDGGVTQLHVPSGHILAEADEQSLGRSMRSIAHSALRRDLVLGACDDGKARLWAGPCMSQSAGVFSVPSGAALTCADFCPYDDNLLALASYDSNAYLYDMRWLNRPLKVVEGHTACVSYVKFMGHQRLVTSSLDATIACWDLDASVAAPRILSSPAMSFSGHTNQKKFIGLSILADEGLIASGSESRQAHAYHVSKSEPLADLELEVSPSSSSQECVNSVCWQPRTLSTIAAFGTGPIMAAAFTEDDIRLLRLNAD